MIQMYSATSPVQNKSICVTPALLHESGTRAAVTRLLGASTTSTAQERSLVHEREVRLNSTRETLGNRQVLTPFGVGVVERLIVG